MSGGRKILFARSGGGMPGLAIHTGMWQALSQAGVVSTHNTGTSAGALIAGLDSLGRSSTFAWALLNGLRDRDLRKERLLWKLRMPWIDSFLCAEPIQGRLAGLFQQGWAGLQKPLGVFAVRECDGLLHEFRGASDGPLCECLRASMSISGVWPAVHVGGANWTDGGTGNNTGLPENWRDFDEVWMLLATAPDLYREPATFGEPDPCMADASMLTRLLRNVHLLMNAQMAHRLAEVWPHRFDVHGKLAERPWVHVLRSNLGRTHGALRVAPELMGQALTWTEKALAAIRERGGLEIQP